MRRWCMLRWRRTRLLAARTLNVMPQSPVAPASPQQSSDCLERVLDTLSEGVVLLGADGRLLRANPTAARLLGADPAALVGLAGKEWETLLKRSLQSLPSPPGEPPRMHTTVLPRRTLTLETHQLADGGSVLLLRDITAELRVQQELLQLKERHARDLTALHTRLDQVEGFKMELTANVTHDLRTPLASIKASVSGLLAGDVQYDKQQLRETLSIIEEETDRLQRRVSNLLSMARMESGASDLSEDW